MNKIPFVDVIIPAYNAELYIKSAVESALQQTYKNIKIYVIDDGSADVDATKNYVKNLNNRHVKYVRKENGGVSSARNIGIQISNSPYIAFLDADDYWSKDKIEKQLDLLTKNNYGMVYGLCKVVDENDAFIRSIELNKQGDLYTYLLSGNKITGSASMVLISRLVLEDVGTFKEGLDIGEDWELWLRIAKKYPIGCVDEYLATIRNVSDSSQKNYLKVATHLEALAKIVLSEQKPKGRAKAKFMSFCLWEATMNYYNGGQVSSAKRVLLQSLKYNPFYFLKYNPSTWVACVRIVLSNELLRKLRRKTSSKYREREKKAKEKT